MNKILACIFTLIIILTIISGCEHKSNCGSNGCPVTKQKCGCSHHNCNKNNCNCENCEFKKYYNNKTHRYIHHR